MKGAIFRAIKNAQNREKIANEANKESGLKKYFKNLTNKLSKVFSSSEEV